MTFQVTKMKRSFWGLFQSMNTNLLEHKGCEDREDVLQLMELQSKSIISPSKIQINHKKAKMRIFWKNELNEVETEMYIFPIVSSIIDYWSIVNQLNFSKSLHSRKKKQKFNIETFPSLHFLIVLYVSGYVFVDCLHCLLLKRLHQCWYEHHNSK
jgi:hypothetical protein